MVVSESEIYALMETIDMDGNGDGRSFAVMTDRGHGAASLQANAPGRASARGVNGGRSEPLQPSTYGCDCAQKRPHKKLQGS